MTCRGPAVLLTAALLGAFCAAPVHAVKVERLSRVSPSSGKASSLEVASGSALVRFKAGVSTSAAAAQLEPAGFRLARTFERFNWSAVVLPPGMSVQAGLAALAASPAVEWAEPNKVYRPAKTSSDTYLHLQYALAQVEAFAAWEYETGSSSRVTVAVIDTGIDGTHAELQGKLAGTSRAINPDTFAASNNQPPTPACNHASRVSGVAAAAANNAAGVAGLSWGAQLISMKVFLDSDCEDDCDDSPGQSCSTSESAIADAVQELISLHNGPTLGKVVANISLGSDLSGCSPAMQAAVNSAASAGIMLFAASGNLSRTVVDSPANCSGVIPVGATDQYDRLAYFSNTDSTMTTKGLTAPGVELYTTDIGGGYASATGTSFASPMAAGLAALIWSAKPAYTAAQVFDAMKNSADDLGAAGPDRDFGWGRINAFKAICSVLSCPSSGVGRKKAASYPNPFRPSVHRMVSFRLGEDMDTTGVEIKVYTSEGELLRKLDGLLWDGKNEAGAPVASGVYIFRVKTDKDSAVGKMALIR
ncbi:MAG: S8 family peptidase [Elusimicrobiales bacterium]